MSGWSLEAFKQDYHRWLKATQAGTDKLNGKKKQDNLHPDPDNTPLTLRPMAQSIADGSDSMGGS